MSAPTVCNGLEEVLKIRDPVVSGHPVLNHNDVPWELLFGVRGLHRNFMPQCAEMLCKLLGGAFITKNDRKVDVPAS